MTTSLTSVVIRPTSKQNTAYEIHCVLGDQLDVLVPLLAAGLIQHGALDMHLLRCGCSWSSPVKGEPLSACSDCFASGWQLHVNDPVLKGTAVTAAKLALRDAGIEVEVDDKPYRYSTEVPDNADGTFDLDVSLTFRSGGSELEFVTTRVAEDVHELLAAYGLLTLRDGAKLHLTAGQSEDVVAVLMYGGSRVTYSYESSATGAMPTAEQGTNPGSQPAVSLVRAHHPTTGPLGNGLFAVAAQNRDVWPALQVLQDADLLEESTLCVDWVPCGCFCTTLDILHASPTCPRCAGTGSELRVGDCLVPRASVSGVTRALRKAGFSVVKPNPAGHVEPSLSESWRTGLRAVSLAVRTHANVGVATVQCELRDRAALRLVSALFDDVGVKHRQGEYGLTTAAADAPYVCAALLYVGCTLTVVDPANPSLVSWFISHTNDAP